MRGAVESNDSEETPDNERTWRSWRSAEVPGLLVKSVERHTTEDGAFDSVIAVVEFFVPAP